MKQQLWEGICEGKPIRITGETVGSDIHIEIEDITEGFLTDLVGGAISFTKAHPFMAAIAVAPWAKLAYDSLKKYNMAKDTAVKFYAKNQPEQIKYWKMVRELEKSGTFKLYKHGHKSPGYQWELRRSDIQ